MLIPNKKKFIKNLYLFLLARNVDKKMLQNSLKNKIKISDYKKTLLNNIINSEEFKNIINSNARKESALALSLVKLNYKLLGLVIVRLNNII